MDVEVLWWEGCPSTPEAIELVREELAALEVDPEALRITEIRVDGRDVQSPTDEPVGLTCRVYRWRDGRTSPLPERAAVREALRAAKGGD